MRVVSTKVGSTSSQGFETWAIGKLMAEEKVNREAMYRVFKSLYFTNEEVNFVSLKEGAILMAMKVGNAIREGLAIDWRDRDGGWTKYMRLRL
ncbi:hypothetical protein PVK06_009158 [Gossypium arboreum]|uniref:Uncharacterized protein n=1 Tax=Gossypium arboreum TaxID=29729 RepID=A0ABR0QLQ2_GOSAR|nr:hypothetical protein PVK06_009158 [Gossypium arboreum]